MRLSGETNTSGPKASGSIVRSRRPPFRTARPLIGIPSGPSSSVTSAALMEGRFRHVGYTISDTA